MTNTEDAVEGGADEPLWLNTDEAARRLGITVRTLYRFIDSGDLPAYRLGRVIRIKPADVDAYIEACRIQPGTVLSAVDRANAT